MDQQLTEGEAEAHIRDIRLKRRIVDGNNNSENWNLRDLRATLKMFVFMVSVSNLGCI
jgi:hypothetical protein